jgi:hypothetical protein
MQCKRVVGHLALSLFCILPGSLLGEVMMVGGFVMPTGNQDALHPNAQSSTADARNGSYRGPEAHPAMNQIELTKTYESIDLGPIPRRNRPLQEHWQAVFTTADILKQALRSVQTDVVASAAHWIHEWTKEYPSVVKTPGLSRSVPTQLDRIRKACSDLTRSVTSHLVSKQGAEAQRVLSELSRLAKLHRRDLEFWREEVDALASGEPLNVRAERSRRGR